MKNKKIDRADCRAEQLNRDFIQEINRSAINSLKQFFSSALCIFALFIVNCTDDGAIGSELETGTLHLMVNGEGFIRDGFTTEDGWAIEFDEAKINITGATAWQATLDDGDQSDKPSLAQVPAGDVNFHAGHPEAGVPEGSSFEGFVGPWFLDLKQDAFIVEKRKLAEVGNYNQLSFAIAPVAAADDPEDNEDVGTTILLKGTAQKGADVVNFTLRFNWEISWTLCGPNEDRGELKSGKTAEVEMTTHFDHIFGDIDAGDAETTDPETVNFTAIGFGPFEAIEAGGYPKTIDLDNEDMQAGMDNATYIQLTYAFLTLAHSGEAHCFK